MRTHLSTINSASLTPLNVGTRERQLESILHSTFSRIILTHAFPRSLIQLTLQVVSSPEQQEPRYSSSVRLFVLMGLKQRTITDFEQNLPILPALLQTGMLTLLSSSLPLECTFTSIALAVRPDKHGGTAQLNTKSFTNAESIHVFAFTSTAQLLLSESEGTFTMQEWEETYDRAKSICCAQPGQGDRMQVEGERQDTNMKQWLHSAIEGQAQQDQAWKS